MGKKGRLVFRHGEDEAALAEGARDACLELAELALSQLAPIWNVEEKTRTTTSRRRSRSTPR